MFSEEVKRSQSDRYLESSLIMNVAESPHQVAISSLKHNSGARTQSLLISFDVNINRAGLLTYWGC